MQKDMVLTLGGKPQIILLEGNSDDLPIMIMLHGGPWGPVVYGAAYRGYYPELSKKYILVWWDQYGCGKNYTKDAGDIVVEDFAKMTVDLVDEIRKLYPDRPVYLNGNSFGAYLATYAAAKRPRDIAGVVIAGPIIDMKQAAENFCHACENRITDKERRKLEESRKKSASCYLFAANALAEKYTNCAHFKGREASDALTARWMLRLFTSKDYRFRDVMGVLKAGSTMGKSYLKLWDSLAEINITQMTEELSMPVLYLQGEEELFVLPSVMEDLVKRHKNMRYIKYKYCGHIPTKEAWPEMLKEMSAFAEFMT